MSKLYEVEIKSLALLREGKKSLITYFRGGPTELIASNVRYLYPQYTKEEDQPVVDITPISKKEFRRRKRGKQIKQKRQLVSTSGFILNEVELDEIMGDQGTESETDVCGQ